MPHTPCHCGYAGFGACGCNRYSYGAPAPATQRRRSSGSGAAAQSVASFRSRGGIISGGRSFIKSDAKTAGAMLQAGIASGAFQPKKPGITDIRLKPANQQEFLAKYKGRVLGVQAGTEDGLTVSETAGGYAYPEIPAAVESGIPDYYAQSRASRGLSKLPPEAGRLARQIGRYVADLPNDPDNRGSIEATIAQVLTAAAQVAAQSGDAENANRLASIAEKWAKRVVKAGGKAPTFDPDKPLSGFDYGAPVYAGLTRHQLAMAVAVGTGALQARRTKCLLRGSAYGAVAYLAANAVLSVLGTGD